MNYSREKYGQDADGNRGTMVGGVEIVDEDTEEIVEKLYEAFTNGRISGNAEITLSVEVGREEYEDVDTDVDIGEYVDELLAKMEKDAENPESDIEKEDVDFIKEEIEAHREKIQREKEEKKKAKEIKSTLGNEKGEHQTGALKQGCSS